jgi:hypothetical protein
MLHSSKNLSAKMRGLNADGNITRYRSLFGCGNVSLPDTSEFYARFTKTVLCSRMIQDSRSDCGLTDVTATPVCADTCVCCARGIIVFVLQLTCCRLNSQGVNK